MSTGDVTIPASVVKAAGLAGWVSIERSRGQWSAETYGPNGLVDARAETIQAALDALAEALRGEAS